MAWGWRGRGSFGPWPGRGPFSHLPPWERPGWLFGRGACQSLFGPPLGYGQYPPGAVPYWFQTQPYGPPRPEDEVTALEESKKELEEGLKGVEARIVELKKALEEKKQEPKQG